MTSKGLIYTLLFILVLNLGLYYIFFPFFIRQKLMTLSTSLEDGVELSFGDVSSAALPVGLKIRDIRFSKPAADSVGEDSVKIDVVSIRHINVFSFLFNEKFSARCVHLQGVDGNLLLASDGDTARQILSPFAGHVNSFVVTDANLFLRKKESGLETQILNFNLTLGQIVLEKNKPIHLQTTTIPEMSGDYVRHISADSNYTFHIHGIHYSLSDSNLVIDSLRSAPNYKPYAFALQHPFQTDRINAFLSGIEVHQFPMHQVIHHGTIVAEEIRIDSFLLDIFRDRRRPFLHKQRPLYQDLLTAYKDTLSIDSIIAKNGKIIFTEQNEKATEPGVIWFTDVEAGIKHLYNKPSSARGKDSMIVDAKALAMGAGAIQFISKGELQDASNTLHFSGRMENIAVSAFNPILRPNASLLATDGYVSGIYFNFDADNTSSKGDLIFRYNNLRLAVVNPDDGDTTGLKTRLLTSVLNKKLLDDNPLPSDTLRHGLIAFERDPEKMFFSYMLKSIFSGIKSSVEK